MSSVPNQRISPQEYLARERVAETKSEYLRGEVFAMAGASYDHNRIKDNLARILGVSLLGGPCEVLSSDQRVKVERTGLYTYPDIVVICGGLKFEDGHRDTLLNPHAIVEVLSDSTEKYDRGTKFAHYRQIPSLQEYVLVAQDRPLLERFVRQPDGDWLLTEFVGLASEFAFQSIPVRVAIADIYAGVKLAEGLGC